MNVYSIGFTKKKAEQFFEILKHTGIRRLIDIRLNNVSQLAGFTKRDDLPYFLQEICHAEYIHQPMLAPTEGYWITTRNKKEAGKSTKEDF